MMRYLILSVLVLLTACANTPEVPPVILNAADCPMRWATSRGMGGVCAFPEHVRFVFVVLSDSPESSDYREQIGKLQSFDFEDQQVMLVPGFRNGQLRGSYHLATEVASGLLGNEDFVLLIYDPKGHLVARYTKPAEPDQLAARLQP
ncbi:hypothetical protein AAIA72_07105 [Hahella sp. SMD15-11]|uniref:Lipoprotein n=1 Tax=Thermohahella caldifontis TaxID=3142973 RepID=A0AB39V0P1_9GAMM